MAFLISNVVFFLALAASTSMVFSKTMPPACTPSLCLFGEPMTRCISALLSCQSKSGRCLSTCGAWKSEFLPTLSFPSSCIGELEPPQRVKCCKQRKRCTAEGYTCYDSQECEGELVCALNSSSSPRVGTCEIARGIPKCSRASCFPDPSAVCESGIIMKCFKYLLLHPFAPGP